MRNSWETPNSSCRLTNAGVGRVAEPTSSSDDEDEAVEEDPLPDIRAPTVQVPPAREKSLRQKRTVPSEPMPVPPGTPFQHASLGVLHELAC